ncbi:MAG: hypothetical protein ACFE0J_22080 [Elainellaceae cyanobacterium]
MPPHLPLLNHLPDSLSAEGSVQIELVEGVPIFRASTQVQSRIEILLEQHKQCGLKTEEEVELNHYEELDDYLSLVNRTIRNLYLNQR